jgi:hypothetical protein
MGRKSSPRICQSWRISGSILAHYFPEPEDYLTTPWNENGILARNVLRGVNGVSANEPMKNWKCHTRVFEMTLAEENLLWR